MSSANRVLLLLFQSGFLLFLFLFWLLWLKLPKLCWIVWWEAVPLFCTWLSGKCFQFFTTVALKIIFAVCLSYMAFFYVEVCSFHACFLENFYHKWMLNFVKGFLCIYLDNHMVFIFQFVNVVYHIEWFVNTEKPLHPWDKAHLVMMYDVHYLSLYYLLHRILVSLKNNISPFCFQML